MDCRMSAPLTLRPYQEAALADLWTWFSEQTGNPLARGGSNWISNIQLLCPRCNTSKKALDPIVWAQREGRLL